MAAKQPVLLGQYTFANASGTITDTVDVISNVSNDLWLALGSPVFDPANLAGDPQENNNGQFQYPKQGTFNGRTVTLITDGVTAGGNPETFQMQIPEFFPLYLFDKWLANLPTPVATFLAFKSRGGRRIVVGSTAVT